jgi:hypothetical protein
MGVRDMGARDMGARDMGARDADMAQISHGYRHSTPSVAVATESVW